MGFGIVCISVFSLMIRFDVHITSRFPLILRSYLYSYQKGQEDATKISTFPADTTSTTLIWFLIFLSSSSHDFSWSPFLFLSASSTLFCNAADCSSSVGSCFKCNFLFKSSTIVFWPFVIAEYLPNPHICCWEWSARNVNIASQNYNVPWHSFLLSHEINPPLVLLIEWWMPDNAMGIVSSSLNWYSRSGHETYLNRTSIMSTMWIKLSDDSLFHNDYASWRNFATTSNYLHISLSPHSKEEIVDSQDECWNTPLCLIPIYVFIFISLAYIQVFPLSDQFFHPHPWFPRTEVKRRTHLKVFLINSLFIPPGVICLIFLSSQFPCVISSGCTWSCSTSLSAP